MYFLQNTIKVGVSATMFLTFVSESRVNKWSHSRVNKWSTFCFMFLKFFVEKSHSPCRLSFFLTKTMRENVDRLLTLQRAKCGPFIDPTAYTSI